MATTTSNKRKKAVAATVAAAALLLGGTFAWTSISQQALNESAGIVNVGGRLHDDFDGTNKDVYVENFTDPLNGGQPIYARVRLDEYMEVGQDAGGVDDGDNIDEVVTILDGTEREKESTWQTHVPSENCAECNAEGSGCVIHDCWEWTMGGDEDGTPDGQTTYMPTFNKDKDSLDSDRNGTYQGTDSSDKVYYDNYIEYTTEESGLSHEGNIDETTSIDGEVYQVKANAKYDDDTNTVDDDVVVEKEETHTAKKTASAEVVLMSDWLEAGGNAGNFWVYDADGWAYWANPIMPGEATGLLLDGIRMKQNPGEKCYYGINVVAQFATVGDWEYFEDKDGNPGLDEDSDAMKVMTAASSAVPTITVSVDANDTAVDVKAGDTVQFHATATVGNETVTDPTAFNWSVVDKEGNKSQNSTIDANGKLTVGKEAQAEWYVVAEYKNVPGAVGLNAVKVIPFVPPTSVVITNTTPDVIVETDRQIKLSAQLKDKDGNTVKDETVKWSITSASTTDTPSTIDQTGLVTVGWEENETELTVTAAWAEDESVSTTYTLKVVVVEDKIATPDGRYYFNPGETVPLDVTLRYTWAKTGYQYLLSGYSDPNTAIDENGVLTIGENETTGTKLTVNIKYKAPVVGPSISIEVGIPVIEIVALNGTSSGNATAWDSIAGMVFDTYIYRDNTKAERAALECNASLDNSAFGASISNEVTDTSETGHITYTVTAQSVTSTIDNPEKYTLNVSLKNDPNVKASFNWGWYAAGGKE